MRRAGQAVPHAPLARAACAQHARSGLVVGLPLTGEGEEGESADRGAAAGRGRGPPHRPAGRALGRADEHRPGAGRDPGAGRLAPGAARRTWTRSRPPCCCSTSSTRGGIGRSGGEGGRRRRVAMESGGRADTPGCRGVDCRSRSILSVLSSCPSSPAAPRQARAGHPSARRLLRRRDRYAWPRTASIASRRWFKLMARVRGVDRSVQAGVYEFPPALALDRCSRAGAREQAALRFTVPEGLTIPEVAALGRRAAGHPGAIPSWSAARDSAAASDAGLSGPLVRGFPPARDLRPAGRPHARDELVRIMAEGFKSEWKPAWTARLDYPQDDAGCSW